MPPRPAAIARVRRPREQKHSSHGQAGRMAVKSGDPEMCASVWRGLTWCPVLVKSQGSSLTHCPPPGHQQERCPWVTWAPLSRGQTVHTGPSQMPVTCTVL